MRIYRMHDTRYTIQAKDFFSCIMHHASCIVNRGEKGTSLVELMIVLTIFSIIGAMMFSTYSTFLKQVTVERKKTKTELDIFNVSWPLIKEIETAGFGVPKTGTCSTPISFVSEVLTIHSTAAGDSQYAGAWSYVYNISTTCGSVYTVAGTTGSAIPAGNVVIINSLDKSRLDRASVGDPTATAGYNFVVACSTDHINNVAYWTPYESTGDLECYETKYALRDYTASDLRPAMCAPDGGATQKVQKLSRSVKYNITGPLTDYEPLLDCVRTLAFRFGCIDSSGNLTWQTTTGCGTAKLRLMKIGMIIQSSAKGASSPETIRLFEDLGAALAASTTLTSEQRNYRWRKLEQTITLKNQE